MRIIVMMRAPGCFVSNIPDSRHDSAWPRWYRRRIVSPTQTPELEAYAKTEALPEWFKARRVDTTESDSQIVQSPNAWARLRICSSSSPPQESAEVLFERNCSYGHYK